MLTVQCRAPCEPHPPGPRNWQPLALTAAHRLAESCWGFWCCRMSSVTVRSPSERPARTARTRPSSSTSWQLTKVTSFLCMGRLSTLGLRVATPAGGDKRRRDRCTAEELRWASDAVHFYQNTDATGATSSSVGGIYSLRSQDGFQERQFVSN